MNKDRTQDGYYSKVETYISCPRERCGIEETTIREISMNRRQRMYKGDGDIAKEAIDDLLGRNLLSRRVDLLSWCRFRFY